jgi:predicted  nucleic acid-binding Zn-ribbon protein
MPSKKSHQSRTETQKLSDPYEKYKKLEDENEALQKENKELRAESEAWKRVKSQAHQEIENATAEKRKLGEEIQQLKGKLEDVTRDLLRVKNELRKAKRDIPAEQPQSATVAHQAFTPPDRPVVVESKQAKGSPVMEMSNKLQIDHAAFIATLETLTEAAREIQGQLEPLKFDLAKIQDFEKRLLNQKEHIRRSECERNKLTSDLARVEQNLHDAQEKLYVIQTKLDQTKQEKEELQKQIQSGNQVIESLNEQLSELKEHISQEKLRLGIEWAQELAPILTKLSSLAELEPEPKINLTPHAIYLDMLDWMERIFGERPKAFPNKRELFTKDIEKPVIFLDVDQADLESLLKLYDWAPDHPFEGLPEGHRKRKFRILHWGWKIRDQVLVKASLSPMSDDDAGEVSMEESHDL